MSAWYEPDTVYSNISHLAIIWSIAVLTVGLFPICSDISRVAAKSFDACKLKLRCHNNTGAFDYIPFSAWDKLWSFPSTQTAIKGMPIGLTRNAMVSRIRPFLTEYVSRTRTPRNEASPLAKRNKNAEQDISPAQTKVNKSRISVTGAVIGLKILFIFEPSLSIVMIHPSRFFRKDVT